MFNRERRAGPWVIIILIRQNFREIVILSMQIHAVLMGGQRRELALRENTHFTGDEDDMGRPGQTGMGEADGYCRTAGKVFFFFWQCRCKEYGSQNIVVLN